ncbi:hypothetical protein GGP41_001056 [Bipolaris sorokiniana]|uniref:Uncharacterized protein n=1 Tax=Cochliobolus sativus TaxID=45130 RepID=A0A8H5Z659_COCSA|nr:hypothetical protein GGP41_001056 [Bipolaris sorokiniana]
MYAHKKILEGWRKLLKLKLASSDDEYPSTDLNIARLCFITLASLSLSTPNTNPTHLFECPPPTLHRADLAKRYLKMYY